MARLTTRGLNPIQLAIVYKRVLEATKGTPESKDREAMKRVIKEEYRRMYPNSYMPKDDKDETLIAIYTNYGMIEDLAESLGLQGIESILECIRRGSEKGKD